MLDESAPNRIQTTELETRLAILRKRAKQLKVMVPKDAALYIAQNVRSNAVALERALFRLKAHSSYSGTEITLAYTQQVLSNFFAAEARREAVDHLQNLSSPQAGAREAKPSGQEPASQDHHFVLCLLKAQEGKKTSRVRHELEVNMREIERERLSRRDAYGRDLECRAKKRKQA